MFRMAIRSILAGKIRFLLPTVAVALGVAFVTGSLLYSSSVRASLEGGTPDFAVQITARSTTDAGVTADVVAKLRAVDGVAEVRPTSEGETFIVDNEGGLVGQPVYAGGVTYDPDYQLTAGRAPAGATEIAIDDWTAKRTGYQVGDQIRFVADGTARDARLAGTFTTSDTRVTRGGTLTAFDDATARALFAKTPDSNTTVSLTTAPGTSESALAANVRAAVSQDEFILDTASEFTETATDGKLTAILLAFAGIALFVSIFLVANTFTMLSAARAREHALLRAVGADRRYVTRMVLAEALVVGVVATVVGYLLGIGVGVSLDSLFGVVDGPPIEPRIFGVEPVLAALGVGIGVTVFAAYIPARRASAVPPIAALRTGLPPTGKSLRRRNTAGFVMTGLGTAITTAAADSEDWLYLGAPLLLLGLITLTPLFGVWLTALLRRPLTRVAGIRGTLAVQNTRRNPRRTGTTASALMIGLAICGAVTVPVASVAAEDARRADTGDRADIRISAIGFAEIGEDTQGRVAQLPGIDAVTPLTPTEVGSRPNSLNVAGVDPATIGSLISFTLRSGSLDDLAGGIAVSDEEADAHEWVVGSVVPGDRPLPIVAIFDAPAGFDYDALVGTANGAPETILIKTAPGRTDSAQAEIRRELNNPTLVVQTHAEYIDAERSQFDAVLNILYALLSISVLIGALSVVNTMTMSTRERVREIGLLRAVGLSRGQVGTILRLESVIIAVLGAITGLVGGCVIGAAAVSSQDGIPVAMPWGRLALFVALTVAIGILAALWPARNAARIPLLRAIHTDTE
ncbi:ABC transporter permease [Amycolatopsis antarctica]|uniref:ABC transporter permease n=1 Tax=Amycolatopsis antarctica TaxID=1854586 RepID=A0A263D053_9PSEU|nr:FtsX-like permease family protein [Amycolatopsis antarctica]OZM71731.1 ABC transporter permease [Amycolatopsis antarctica]